MGIWVWVVFPVHSVSAHIAHVTTHGLMAYLIYCHGISHSIASDQGTHFTANEVHQWACANRSHYSYHIPPHSKAST